MSMFSVSPSDVLSPCLSCAALRCSGLFQHSAFDTLVPPEGASLSAQKFGPTDTCYKHLILSTDSDF